MGEVVVVTGPIAAGKSTASAALAARLADGGRSVAVCDLDEVVDTLWAPGDDLETAYSRARRAHAALVAGWLAAGIDVVVVDGPFVVPAEQDVLLAALPAGVTPRWALVVVPYDVALVRVADDPTRVLSRDAAFLAATHERFAARRHEIPPCEWTFDATAVTADEIAAAVAADLLR